LLLAKRINAILSFDDGLKEHYTIAYPLLKKHHMRGIFFIPTDIQNNILQVHKIWLLLDQHLEKELINELGISKEPYLDKKWYIGESIKVANLKYYLDSHPDVLNKSFSKYVDKKDANDFYMNFDEVQEMSDNGMLIGGHTHTHPLLSSLSYDEQEKEIEKSTGILRTIQEPLWFSYPFADYNQDTVELIKKYGYRYAVSGYTNTFNIARVDTNEFN
jgi:peptidoglycan/xylan/chitin deacetylase (PgdA/CDA1 family)